MAGVGVSPAGGFFVWPALLNVGRSSGSAETKCWKSSRKEMLALLYEFFPSVLPTLINSNANMF